MAKLPSVGFQQRRLNWFTSKYLYGVTPLIVDGKLGASTKKRISYVRYYLGEHGKRRVTWSEELRHRTEHFNDRRYPASERKDGAKRRRAQKLHWLRNHVYSYVAPGVVRFEGVAVAKVAIPYLEYARSKGWHGGLNSGWRDPKYSESLCYAMCGRSTCPGQCAGRSSNHSGTAADHFAIDVSDSATFGQIMAHMPNPPHGIRIHNSLGSRDVVHFSPSGY